MVIQISPMKEDMRRYTVINIKVMLIATVIAILFICDLTVAQHPYGLKRPSYCSTCSTNEKSENYYCCHYFFRCCTEYRLAAKNRKVTTSRPDYPDLHTTQEQPIMMTTASDIICKDCIPRNRNTGGARKKPDVAAPSDGENMHFSPDGQQKFIGVAKTNEEVTTRYVDASELSRDYSDVRIPGTKYSPAFDRRRYAYHFARMYSSQQPSRNTAWSDPEDQNSNYGGSRTRYRETV